MNAKQEKKEVMEKMEGGIRKQKEEAESERATPTPCFRRVTLFNDM